MKSNRHKNVKIMKKGYNKTSKVDDKSTKLKKDVSFCVEAKAEDNNNNACFDVSEIEKNNFSLESIKENNFDNKNDSIEEISNGVDINKECSIKNEENSSEEYIEDGQNISDNNESIEQKDESLNDIHLSEEIINEKVKSAIEFHNKKKKKNIIFSLCLLVLNLVFMYFIVKNLMAEIDGNIFEIFDMQGNKLWWLLGGVFSYILAVVMQVLIYKVLLKSLSGKSITKVAYDTAVVGRYYDNVTPFAVGGQPMQIVSLIGSNVSPAVATGIPLIKMVINTGMSAISALVFFVLGLPVLKMDSPLNKILLLVLEVLGVIGLVITLFITIFMFLISSGTLITRSFISGVLRLGYKLKIVKNYRQTYRKVLNQVAEYKFSMKYLLKNKGVLFKLIGLTFIENVAYALILFFVIMSLMTTPIDNIMFFMFI